MGHRDAHGVIAPGDGPGGQAVPLGAHDDGQLGFGPEAGVRDVHRVLPQGHGRRPEAQCVQRFGPVFG